MAGDLGNLARRADSLSGRFERAKASYMATLQKSIDRRAQKRREEEEAKRRAALEQQRAEAELKRDKQQHQYGQANTAQRAMYAADAQTADFRNTSKLNKQQQQGILKRDQLQADYEKEQARQAALAQQARDGRLFGFSMQENQQQFGNQLQRDALQQGYTLDRDRLQQGNTLERDAVQFGFDTQRARQQQRDTLERDFMQGGIQSQRDQRLNEFDVQADERQFRNQTARDEMQQGFQQQNMYQREAADISAQWQDQVAQARNAGLDFSERQKKEMADLDASFRKNVLNGPYDEGLKMRAMVEHQKKLAAIIPEDKVQNPQDGLNSSVMFHEPTGTWFIQARDARGNPVYEPMGSQSGQGEDKQAAVKRDALFEREDRFQKIVDKLAMKEKPGGIGEPLYTDHADVLKAAMQEFAPLEQHYRSEYGLPPLSPYQAEADRIRAAEIEARDAANPRWQGPKLPANRNPYRDAPAQQPAAPKPVSVSSTDLDNQMTQMASSGDRESAAALQALKDITARHGGAPPDGSEDQAILRDAIAFLTAKGVTITPKKKSASGKFYDPIRMK